MFGGSLLLQHCYNTESTQPGTGFFLGIIYLIRFSDRIYSLFLVSDSGVLRVFELCVNSHPLLGYVFCYTS